MATTARATTAMTAATTASDENSATVAGRAMAAMRLGRQARLLVVDLVC